MTELQSTLVNDTATQATTPLSAHDRCDSCGAQAYVRVTLPSGALLFCGHHAAKHKEQLSGQALTWHDETFRLSPTQPELDVD
jgi:hypothetical protein